MNERPDGLTADLPPDLPQASEDPRSASHLAVLNQYRLELAQGLRSVSLVSGHLAVVTETGDPHGVFDQNVQVLDTLVRQVSNSLASLKALAESASIA